MIEKIYDFWGIKDEYIFGDEFTGYEDLYSEFDKLTKEEYERSPDETIDRCFDLYLAGIKHRLLYRRRNQVQ